MQTFEEVCKSAPSMRVAAIQLEMPFSSFKRLAIERGCWKPNQGRAGILRIPLSEVFMRGSATAKSIVKNRLLQLRDAKCEECSLTEWLGKRLVLELHHIDGDSTNQELQNLQLLCPNCHSQTNNFRKKKAGR